MPTNPVKEKEDDFDKCLKECCIDAGVKTGTSFAIGLLSSAFFAKMKLWPVILCTSVGICMAYKNCDKTLSKYKPEPIPKRKCV